MSENIEQAKTLCDMAKDKVNTLRDDNRTLINISKVLLEVVERSTTSQDELLQIAILNDDKDKLYMSEINRLQREIVELSKENKELEEKISQLEKEKYKDLYEENRSENDCPDCVPVTPMEIDDPELVRMAEAATSVVQEKQANGEFTTQEAIHYLDLLNQGNAKVVRLTCNKLGIYSSTPTPILHGDDIAMLKELHKPVYPTDE